MGRQPAFSPHFAKLARLSWHRPHDGLPGASGSYRPAWWFSGDLLKAISCELLWEETEPCARTGKCFGNVAVEVRQTSRIGLPPFLLSNQEADDAVLAVSLHFSTRNVPKGSV